MIPPIVREVEAARLAAARPTSRTSRTGRATTSSSASSTTSTTSPSCSRSEASQLPAKLGDAAGRRARRSPSASSTTSSRRSIVLTLPSSCCSTAASSSTAHRPPARARSASACAASARGSPRIVRSYVSVNLLLAALAGVFTWLALELLGVELAVPLAVLVALPRPGPADRLHVGGLLVAVVAGTARLPERADRSGLGAVPRLPAAPGPRDPADPLQERGPDPPGGRGRRRARRRPARRHPRRPAGDPGRRLARCDLRRALAAAAKTIRSPTASPPSPEPARRRPAAPALAPSPRPGSARSSARSRAVAVEEPRPERVRLRQPDAPARPPAGQKISDDQRHPELLLRRVDQRDHDPDQRRRTPTAGEDARPRRSSASVDPGAEARPAAIPARQPAMIIASIDLRPSFSQ